MGLVNKTTLNFIVEQGGKFGRSLLTVKPPKIVNVEGLTYMPQKLSTDIVEFSQKAFQQNKTEINLATLQELAEKGLSLNEIAKELGVKIGKLRLSLRKNDVVTDAQKKYRVIKKYFSATSQEEKIRAFEEVDNYLKEIAKEEVKLHKGYSYEDCLQDVRLRFFELIAKKESGRQLRSSILKTVQESAPISGKKGIKTVGLNKLTPKDIEITDKEIEFVEINDYRKCFMNKLAWVLRSKELTILKMHYCENNTIEQIAERLEYTSERIREILKTARKKAVNLQKKMFKNESEYIQDRINIAMDQNRLVEIMGCYGYSKNQARAFMKRLQH